MKPFGKSKKFRWKSGSRGTSLSSGYVSTSFQTLEGAIAGAKLGDEFKQVKLGCLDFTPLPSFHVKKRKESYPAT